MAGDGGEWPAALVALLSHGSTNSGNDCTPVIRDLLFFPLQLDELPSTREPSPKERDTLP